MSAVPKLEKLYLRKKKNSDSVLNRINDVPVERYTVVPILAVIPSDAILNWLAYPNVEILLRRSHRIRRDALT